MAYKRVNELSLAAVADVIREKTGSSDKLVFPEEWKSGIRAATKSLVDRSITEYRDDVTETVGKNAFAYCSYLTVVDFASVKSFQSQAFYMCQRLETIILRRTDMVCEFEDSGALYGTPFMGGGVAGEFKRGTVYVPSVMVESYKTAGYWASSYNNNWCDIIAIEGSEYE